MTSYSTTQAALAAKTPTRHRMGRPLHPAQSPVHVAEMYDSDGILWHLDMARLSIGAPGKREGKPQGKEMHGTSRGWHSLKLFSRQRVRGRANYWISVSQPDGQMHDEPRISDRWDYPKLQVEHPALATGVMRMLLSLSADITDPKAPIYTVRPYVAPDGQWAHEVTERENPMMAAMLERQRQVEALERILESLDVGTTYTTLAERSMIADAVSGWRQCWRITASALIEGAIELTKLAQR